ncbi:MAG: antitoxin VapB family protein [Methanomicrobiaceae archaeon]|nr:antitoxin VapB family protein [Methanomicrobiaceae archaeon]
MKTITLRPETYHALAERKREGESFSDVIDRILEGKPSDIRRYAGALRDSPLLDELAKETAAVRRSARARL